jgi:CBS domain-containing protein
MMMRARDIMTRNVVSVKPDATLEQATNIMLERRISGLPVVEEMAVSWACLRKATSCGDLNSGRNATGPGGYSFSSAPAGLPMNTPTREDAKWARS